MSAGEPLRRAHVAFQQRAWGNCWAALAEADRDEPLTGEDLALYATVAYLTGRPGESADLWTRAHSHYLAAGNINRAARCAIQLGVDLLNAGEGVRGMGWVDKARRLLEDHPSDCVEMGFLLLPDAVRVIGEDAARAEGLFERAAQIGRRFGDADLTVMARHGQGRAMIRCGRVREGCALLDEAMVALEAGEVSPAFAGHVYCSVIEASLEIFDVRRAREWTTSLAHWCKSQSDLVAYTGQCLVRRAEIMQLHGDWADAVDVAREACEHFLRGPAQRATAAAFYQQGELQRLRGDFTHAEESYREAARRGRQPQPGMSLMRLAQGQPEAAAAGIREALAQAKLPGARCRILPPFIDVMLGVKDLEAARAASEELTQLSAGIDAPVLHAAARQARGAVALATGDARAALNDLRAAWAAWDEIEAPYEAARTRELIASACRALGDADAAALELDAARWAFEKLSATPDLERVQTLARKDARGGGKSTLTDRELQVLRLVAAGLTNRAVAARLRISEKTVARHVSNIFTKLGLSSRAAATAYAYEHGVAGAGTT